MFIVADIANIINNYIPVYICVVYDPKWRYICGNDCIEMMKNDIQPHTIHIFSGKTLEIRSGKFEWLDNHPVISGSVRCIGDMTDMFSGSAHDYSESESEYVSVSELYNFPLTPRHGVGLWDLSFISSWDMSSVTNMTRMFRKRSFQTSPDISKWDTSSVKCMAEMFGWSNFNGDISSWNVSNVTNMNRMFEKGDFNKDISSWDVSNVTNMDRMFEDSIFDDDISRWNVSSVTNMDRMFYGSEFSGSINLWDTSSVSCGEKKLTRNFLINLFLRTEDVQCLPEYI